MKQFLFAPFVFFLGLSFGQNFSVSGTDTTFYGNITDSDFDSRFVLYNDSTANFPMSWSVESSNVEASWDFSVCDPSTCYPIGTTAGSFILSTSIFNRIMNLHYYPNNTNGQSTVTVKLWEDAYPNDYVLLTWTGIVGTVGANNEVASYSISAFPNPAVNKINISYDLSSASNNNEIVLYNLLGKKIDSKKIPSQKGSVQFSDNLNPGVYLYVLVSNGQPLITNRVILR